MYNVQRIYMYIRTQEKTCISNTQEKTCMHTHARKDLLEQYTYNYKKRPDCRQLQKKDLHQQYTRKALHAYIFKKDLQELRVERSQGRLIGII